MAIPGAIVGWRIYYANGNTEDSEWSTVPDVGVVAVAVFQGDRLTRSRKGDFIESYRTFYYEDDGDAEDLGFPQYFFWRHPNGTFGAGYTAPGPPNQVKQAAPISDHADSIFTALGAHKRWVV